MQTVDPSDWQSYHLVIIKPLSKVRGLSLYLTRFVFFYKIGEGMDTTYKSATFSAKIGT